MKKLVMSLGLLVAFVLAPVEESEASYYANCKVRISVKKVHPKSKKTPKNHVMLTFKLLKILSAGGHSNSACSKFLNKDVVWTFGIPHWAKGKLKRGRVFLASYSESNGMTPHGVVSNHSWMLLPFPKK